MIISIDGPAASGKSTTARLLAKKLDFLIKKNDDFNDAMGRVTFFLNNL